MDFDEIIDKASYYAKIAADKTSEFTKTAAEKSLKAARIAKLKIENSAEREKIRRLYAEIGKAYFEKHGDDCAEEFEDSVGKLMSSFAQIQANMAEIDGLRSGPEAEEPEDAEVCEEPAETDAGTTEKAPGESEDKDDKE